MRFQLLSLVLLSTIIWGGCSSSKKQQTVTKETVQKEVPIAKPIELKQAPTTKASPIKADASKEQEQKRLKKQDYNKEMMSACSESLYVSLERTSCYGRCPTYSIKIFKNGKAEYIGKKWVEKEGKYSFTVSKEIMKGFEKKIAQFKIYSLKDIYETQITDFPSTITYVNINGKRKRILDENSGPKELKEFNKYIDSLIDNKEMKLTE